MNAKERIFYNKTLAEQIKKNLEVEEIFIYDHNMVFKDSCGNFVKIEFIHFKNEESYKDFQRMKEITEMYEQVKLKKMEELKKGT